MVKSVNFKAFKPENVVFTNEGEIKSKAAGVSYYRIKIAYKYDDGSFGPLYIEGPMETSRGPMNDPKDGKDNWNVFTKFDLSNPEQYAFVNRDDRDGKELGTLYKLFNACAKFVYDNRKECGLNNLKNLDACNDKFRDIMMWTLEDGYPKTGTNPAKYWNLTKYEWQGKSITTNFTLPTAGSKDGITLDWSEIDGNKVQIDHIPVIKIENITIASQIPSIKMAMYSSVISKWAAKARENMQAGTMTKMLEDAAKAAELEALRKEVMELRAKNSGPKTPVKLPPNPVKIDIVEKAAAVVESVNEVISEVTRPAIPGIAEMKSSISSASTTAVNLNSVLNSTAGISLSGDEDEIEL